MELFRRSALVPFPDCRKRLIRIAVVEILRCVEDQFVADEAARIVARGIVIVRAQVVCRTIRQLPIVSDIKQSDFGAAALITVTNHDDGVA